MVKQNPKTKAKKQPASVKYMGDVDVNYGEKQNGNSK